ncbi:Fungal Zn(2)-Cys(6) binuclear cluster domain-containing protein 17 [Elsinoe fawcettii]|nr:Fungal Zn(2)-Cys(6) binuclear cluster domain-containing protein 17 [Elsinoe fawcettii]
MMPSPPSRIQTRKPHSKSRNGCVPCKRRRVKCDEQGPPCVSCTVRKAESQCYYIGRPSHANTTSASASASPGPPQPRASPASHESQTLLPPNAATPNTSQPITPATTPTTSLPHPNGSTSAEATGHSLPSLRSLNLSSFTYDRNVDLELMRQWCTKSHLSAARVETDIPTYLGSCTDLAFKHAFLMDMILGLSSLQLGAEHSDPTTAARYVGRALQYQDAATTAARIAAANASGDNYDALYLFSILNMVFSMVSPQLPSNVGDTPESPIQGVLVSFQLIMMVERIVESGRQYIENSPFAGRNTITPMVVEWQEACKRRMAEPLHRLRAMVGVEIEAGHVKESAAKAHRDAIDWLFQSLDKELVMCIAVLAWAGWSFVEDVKAEHDSALLILLHWGVMVNSLKLAWWAQLISTRVIDEISHKLKGKKGGEWDAAIQWARVTVGLPLISMKRD